MAKQADQSMNKQEAIELAAQKQEVTDQSQLRAMSEQVGNAEMQERMAEAGGARDELLQFVMARLNINRSVQLTEFSVLRDHNSWYRRVSRGNEVAPDPRRWHKPARIYRRAIYALCAGETARANALIEAGIQAEITAFDGLNERVQNKLSRGEERPKERPAAAAKAGFFPTCPPCKVPEQVSITDRIEELDPEAFRAEIRKSRARGNDMWWEKAEDEIEEEANKSD